MPASSRLRLVCLAGLLTLDQGCTAAIRTGPVPETHPRERAHRIYEALLARGGSATQRDPGTLAGFPEAPTPVARQLRALAAAEPDRDQEPLSALHAALQGTGYYSRVRFTTRPDGGTIKYRPIATTDAKTAHAGWNALPIGFYLVWSERNGTPSSPTNEYEIIARQIEILVHENAD